MFALVLLHAKYACKHVTLHVCSYVRLGMLVMWERDCDWGSSGLIGSTVFSYPTNMKIGGTSDHAIVMAIAS